MNFGCLWFDQFMESSYHLEQIQITTTHDNTHMNCAVMSRNGIKSSGKNEILQKPAVDIK